MRVLMTVLTVVGSVADTSQMWAVQLASEDGEVASQVARDLGVEVVGKVFGDVFLMRGESEGRGDDDTVEERISQKELNHHLIVWSEQQLGRRRTSGSKRTDRAVPEEENVRSVRQMARVARVRETSRQARDIGGLDREIPSSPWNVHKTRDPLRWRQWYLGPGAGMQLNVTGLWESGVRGAGVSVAILDDGVELTHLDLALNYDPAASWDLVDSDPDPTPVPWSRHGTQLAGIIAATHFNGMCGMGVAPWSGVGAIRMLGYVVWDATEAAALSYERNHVDVYLAAWGPVDTGAVLEGPGVLAARAIRESIVLGRKGRGSIYVWASGNGGFVGDDCNADGYANSIYTLTVSGSTRGGRSPSYTETCAATFVSTYSGDADEYDSDEEVNGVVTTDTGGVCTESFRGSSVSAAMVAGACALALDVNSELGWRDMQYLMVRAATPHNPIPTQWSTNGIGLRYSHYFGFGSLNVGKMVDLARRWKSVPPAFRCHLRAPYHNITLIPDEPLVLSLSVPDCQVVQLEHVQIDASISARSRGQLEVSLESPSGTVSALLPKRPLDLSPYGIYNHPLTSVHMWGEDPRGTWKLRLTYYNSSVIGPFGSKRLVEIPNMLHNWTLIIHGTEVALERATPYHYYYNSEQLSQMAGRQNRTVTSPGLKKAKNPTQPQEDGVRVEVQHWSSPVDARGNVHSYLYCRVRARVPGAVRGLTWYTGNRETVKDVVRRLSGKGSLAAKYPTILLIRKTKTINGNFTCRLVYNNEVFSRNLEVRGNYSTVPEVTEKTQVSVEGGKVVLACSSFSPILRGTWTRDEERVKPTERVIIGEEKLTITDVQRQDLGVYKCRVRSPRFHYSHTVVITLLLAQGPSTLITYYAVTSQPPPPPPATSATATCTTQENTTTSEVNGGESLSCPEPFNKLEGHCLLVAPGEARSWHRARTQCQRQGGDLLVLQDAALMLALMQLFHSQGLRNNSFWVGGLRQGKELWWWVDGTHLPLGQAFWYPTPSRRPKEIPETRLHRDLPHGRRQASHRPSLVGVGKRRVGSGAGRAGGSPLRSLAVPRPGAKGSRLSRKQHIPASPRLIHPEARDIHIFPTNGSVASSREADDDVGHSIDTLSHTNNSGASLPTPHDRRLFVSRRRKERRRQRQQLIGRTAGETVSERPGPGVAQDQEQHTPLVPVLPGSPDPGQQQQQLPSEGRRRQPPQRAVCLWARFGHFFGSCSVRERLKALCEHKPGT